MDVLECDQRILLVQYSGLRLRCATATIQNRSGCSASPTHLRRADDIRRASFSARRAFLMTRSAGMPFSAPESISLTRRSTSPGHATPSSESTKSPTLSMILSANCTRERGGSANACFSNERRVMSTLYRLSRRRIKPAPLCLCSGSSMNREGSKALGSREISSPSP